MMVWSNLNLVILLHRQMSSFPLTFSTFNIFSDKPITNAPNKGTMKRLYYKFYIIFTVEYKIPCYSCSSSFIIKILTKANPGNIDYQKHKICANLSHSEVAIKTIHGENNTLLLVKGMA